ncbi:DUF4430 domain-containing protein [Aneurinibacillus sp. Ricciae_BoGa-3]|uniref:DUF4430 domain-containing protein n=1 Tax=Aneurinibacillus sp. Ricciae_BoGa-3 TaxID=3022697 RepID=UPI0023401873|nr:DUF4430 domain-containing protein [Aneurinibacillus sp. Ricciae_BoGa-3]WCK56603.1 DUF4430 domain-containing protein [Aneurinibacillus sp. Ricciae_BoGa-3]
MSNWKTLVFGCALITGLLSGCSGPASTSQQSGASSAPAVQQASSSDNGTQTVNSSTAVSETQPGKLAKPGQLSQPEANTKTVEQKKAPVTASAAAHTAAATPTSTSTPQAKVSSESSDAPKPVTQAAAYHNQTVPVSPVVTLQIIGDKQHSAILPVQSVMVKDGDTVLDILTRCLKQNNMQYEYSGALSTAYIKGIDNLYEFDDGPKSGWMFKVNSRFSDKSAGSYRVKAGDSIVWMYTMDSGKDIGAK